LQALIHFCFSNSEFYLIFFIELNKRDGCVNKLFREEPDEFHPIMLTLKSFNHGSGIGKKLLPKEDNNHILFLTHV